MNYPEALFEGLTDPGWVVLDDALLPGLVQQLHQQAVTAWESGNFRSAMIGREHSKTLNAAIRGDSICWLDTPGRESSGNALIGWAQGLRRELNQRFFLALKSEEFHFARYPKGRGYRKHLDQHQHSAQRRISIVLYLNADWHADDGGELCLYSSSDPEQEVVRILPRAGRLVVFRSDTIQHEVLPGQRTRWSVAGWLRTDPGC